MSLEEQQYMNCTRQALHTLLYGHDHLASEQLSRPTTQGKSVPELVMAVPEPLLFPLPGARLPLGCHPLPTHSSRLQGSPSTGSPIRHLFSSSLTLTTSHQTLPFWPLLHLFDSLHFRDPPSPAWTAAMPAPWSACPQPCPSQPILGTATRVILFADVTKSLS